MKRKMRLKIILMKNKPDAQFLPPIFPNVHAVRRNECIIAAMQPGS